MKRPLIDRVVGYFSPRAELSRSRLRKAAEIVRAYDAASSYGTSDWSTANNSSANSEVRAGQKTIRSRSRDLVRNSPYANKALNVIVSNTVGAGIVPKIKGRTKTQEKAITEKWKQWADTTACDKDNKNNFYGLQAAALRSIVESGEALGKKGYYSGVAKIQLLEPDFLNTSIGNSLDNIEGIWLDPRTNLPVAYELYKSHPGDFRAYNLDSVRVSADDIIHAYRIERLGQLRGMPWFYSVANAIKDFADYQNSTLIRQKVAACVTAFVSEKEGDASLDPAFLQAQREADNMLEPGAIRYLGAGQTMTLASPPGVDQYDPFARQTLRSIAAGLGISYEALTGDYSQVNFSSGRMGHLEMQRNIDMWRWQMLIPQFCTPAFDFFLKWLSIQGIDVNGVTVEWTCPAREMIDPSKELAALATEVRAGFKSLPEAIRERGLDPDQVIQEAAEFNEKLDALGLKFDTDPRHMSAQGMSQPIQNPTQTTDNSGDSNSGDTNQEDDSDSAS